MLSLRFDQPLQASFAFEDRAEADLMLALLNQAFLSADLLDGQQKERLSAFRDCFQAFCLSL